MLNRLLLVVNVIFFEVNEETSFLVVLLFSVLENIYRRMDGFIVNLSRVFRFHFRVIINELNKIIVYYVFGRRRLSRNCHVICFFLKNLI